MKEMRNIKIKVNMYDDTKFKIIDTKPERDLIHYIWTRMLTLAGKVNLDGELFLSRNIPYSDETLAIEFNRDVMQIKLALKVLMELEMITLGDDKVYKVKNFTKYQNVSQNKRIVNKQEKEVKYEVEEKSEDKINEISSKKKEKSSSNDDLISNESSEYKGVQSYEFKEQEEDTINREADNKSEINTKNKIKRKESKVEDNSEGILAGLRNKNNSKKKKSKKLNKNGIIEAKDDKLGELIEFYEGDTRPLGKNERVIMEFKV